MKRKVRKTKVWRPRERVIIMKSRQVGKSTMTAMHWMWDRVNMEYINAETKKKSKKK